MEIDVLAGQVFVVHIHRVAVGHRIQITPSWRRARSGRNTRCRYPIVSACRAAPPMPDQSGATIFGGGRCGRFLVTARTMATASGIVIASRTRPQESPKLMGEATYREGLWLDLRHGCSPQGGSTLCLSGTGGHRLRPVISTFIHVPIRNSYGPFLATTSNRRRLGINWEPNAIGARSDRWKKSSQNA